MESFYYTAIGLLAMIVHLIINHDYHFLKDVTKDIREYQKYLSCIFIYYMSDAAWGFLHGRNSVVLLYIDTVIYYIAMGLSVYLCCKYIISFLNLGKKTSRILKGFGITFFVTELLILTVNHFFPIFFRISEKGIYDAFSLRDWALIVQCLMFGVVSLISFVIAMRKPKGKRSRNMTIVFFGLCMTASLIAQTFYPLCPYYTIGMMIGTLIIHVFVHNDELYTHVQKIEELNGKLQEEQKILQQQRDETATALGIINGLSHDYHTIWVVDKTELKLRMVRAPGEGVIKESVKLAFEYKDCNEAMQKYIDLYVCEEDKERLRQMVTTDVVLEKLRESDFYAVNYMRRKENGETDYNQIAFANANTADGKQQFVFGFRDINDILQQEMALRKELSDAKREAESANAAKTSFLFNMSHDIRTPMNAIIGFRNLLEKNQDDAEKRTDYLKKIGDASNVLLSIINNVLEMARIEKGVLELNETVWDVEQMNDTMYSVFADMMMQKGLEFTREIDVQHPAVYCDATKTREIFCNIISNAYKYTPSGGRIHMALKEIPSDRAGYAKYQTTISDNGIGMSEDFLPHLFEEFSRERNFTHSKIEGTGLGMPIVKRLVDFLGGTIEVESQKNVGTTFVVTLYHRISQLPSQTETEKDNREENFEGKRILLAEDNELNAEIAVAILSEIGIAVDRVADGQECLDRLKEAEAGTYDLILMDIQMPRMNGYETAKAIRALEDKTKSQTRIVAMTANAFEEDKREAFKAGMNGHLAKPIDVGELVKALNGSLA